MMLGASASPARSAIWSLGLRLGLAVAILSGSMVCDAAAQSEGGGGGGRGGSVFVPSSGGHGFPVGLGIGLGLALGAGILAAILSSEAHSATTDTGPGEPPPDRPRGPDHLPGHPRYARASIPIVLEGAAHQPSHTHKGSRRSLTRKLPQPPNEPPRRTGVGSARPGFDVPTPTERRYVPDEVLMTTKAPVDLDRLRRLEVELGLTPLATTHVNLLDADVHLYRLRPGASVTATIRELRRRPLVAEAEPNYAFALQDATVPPAAQAKPPVTPVGGNPPATTKPTPSTPPVQYAVAALHLTEAHRFATGDGVRVAVIDSGIDESNPDIEGAVAERLDAVGGTFTPQDHGTAMGGAIVAHHTLTGVAPKARLIAVRAFSGKSSQGSGTGYNILRGLDFAAGHAARIVNMSFAGPRDMLLRQALDAARQRGIIAIAAAGNGGASAGPLYPAAEDGVIAITATDATDQVFALANRGRYIAVAAPGVDVIAPGLGTSVQLTTGTSIAAAEASGVAALLLEKSPQIGTAEIRKILRATARRIAVDPVAAGAGLIDAQAALGMAM